MHRNLAQMTVDGLQSVAMIQDNAIPVDAERGGINYFAIVGGKHVNMLGAGKIVAKMDLLIDLLALVGVVPHISEVCLHFCVGLLHERLRPKKPGLSLQVQIRESVVVSAPHLAVDLYESSGEIARAVRIKFIYHLLHEMIVHRQVADAIFRLLTFWELERDAG